MGPHKTQTHDECPNLSKTPHGIVQLKMHGLNPGFAAASALDFEMCHPFELAAVSQCNFHFSKLVLSS